MNLDRLRRFCLSLPDATEKIQWGNDLLFCVGGKIFVGVGLEPGSECALSFKTTPEQFAELLEREGTMPAPYVGRYHWIGLRDSTVLPWPELQTLIRGSYDLVAVKLPKTKGKTAAGKTTRRTSQRGRKAKPRSARSR